MLRSCELCKSWLSWNLKVYKTLAAFLNLSINPIFFINSFYIYFYKFFFIYIKMSKNSSAKYYQENKERLQKKTKKTKSF